MKQTKLLMGMPITVIIEGSHANASVVDRVFEYFTYVDENYSPYKETSEVSKINAGLPESEWTAEMRDIMKLCEQTKQETNGYFDIYHADKMDPSGLVKGWAIQRAAELVRELGCGNFYIDAGGDIQVSGLNDKKQLWRIGIRNPFDRNEIIKVITISDLGVATSGTYIRGQHIYNPKNDEAVISDIASLTVIGPNIYEADRFATAAFAMGKDGITFIESLKGFEGYMVNNDKLATMTSGFESYVEHA